MDPSEPAPLIDPTDTTIGNRFAPYTPENHSAPLWIVSLLGLIYTTGVLMIRVFIKRRVFGWDDTTIVAGTITGVVQSAIFFKALNFGLGQTAEHSKDIRTTARWTFVSQILLLIALCLAKCSGILLLRRLFIRDHKKLSLIYDISLGFIVLCGIATLVLASAGCPTTGQFNQHCSNQQSRWSVVTALDIFTEIILLLLPAFLVWQLQMKTTYKFRVIVAFCFRILVIVFSAIHLNERIKYTKGSPSPFNIVPTLIWHQALLVWSLISATIPNLKAFLQSLSANWGGADWGYTVKAYGNGTFEMKNMGSSRGMASGAHPEAISEMDRKYQTQIETRQVGERSSLGSGGSQDMIIRKETAFTVVRT